MFTLNTNDALYAIAGTSSSISYTIMGMTLSSINQQSYGIFAQGLIQSTPSILYASPSVSLIKTISIVNVTPNIVNNVIFYFNGTSSANIIKILTLNGTSSAIFNEEGWEVYDQYGVIQTGIAGPQGIAGSVGSQVNTGSTGYNGTFQTLTFSSPYISWDVSQGQNAQVLMTGNATLSISNSQLGYMQSGTFYNLIVIQDATGSRILNGPTLSAIVGAGGGLTGTSLKLSTTGAASDFINLFYTGVTNSSVSGVTASWYVSYGLNYT